jgi:hypothetical protein
MQCGLLQDKEVFFEWPINHTEKIPITFFLWNNTVIDYVLHAIKLCRMH